MQEISRADLLSEAKEQITLEKPQYDAGVAGAEWRRGPNQPANRGNQNNRYFRLRDYDAYNAGETTTPYYDVVVVLSADETATRVQLDARVTVKGPHAELERVEETVLDTSSVSGDGAEAIVSNNKSFVEAKLQQYVDEFAEMAAETLAERLAGS